MTLAIVTLATSAEWELLAEITLPTQREYATRISAEFVVLNKRIASHSHYDKWQIYDLLPNFDRIIFMDADMIVRSDCPDLFEKVPLDRVGGENELLSYPGQADHLDRFLSRAGMDPTGCPFYLNSGLFVVSACHRELFRPPEIILADLPWPEQSHFNARLISEHIPVCFLPPSFNDRHRKANYLRDSFILHYSVMPIEEKIAAATHDLASWNELRGHDPTEGEAGVTKGALREKESDSLHEQGLSLARQRRFEEATGFFRRVVEVQPNRADAIRHLAQACTDCSRWSEAEEAWLRFLELRPDSADAHRHLGNLRRRTKKHELAVESLKKAVDLDPQSPAFQVDYGLALNGAKQRPEAKQAFLRAMELQPDYYDAYINIGILLQEMKEKEEAVSYLQKSIELRPDDPSGYNNLGVAFAEQGRFAEAIACYEKLLEKTPDYFLAWNNIGNAFRAVGRNEEAMTALQKALEFKPDYAEAYNNLGIIQSNLEEFAKAIHCYDQALLLRPDYPEAHANRGLICLLLGNFQQGWADYEWRWHGNYGLKQRQFTGKRWDGSPLAGKRILLYFEQGFGDTFQFIRYAKDLKSRGATIIFECQPTTRQILSRTPGIDEFVIRGDKPPPCDFYAPLLSLPGLCQTNLDNLPRRVPYIFADPALVWEWKQRLARVAGFKIGIVWQGSPEHKADRHRSIPLKCFEPLSKVPGVTLITLQKNLGTEQIAALEGRFPLLDFKEVAEDGDGWLRTAAIISNLDLVISADTSVVHLAGAMGIPAWVALPTSPDWRWLLEREDTPWYPTARLFRQSRTGDWDELFGRIAEALRQRLSMSGSGAEPPSELIQRQAQELLQKANGHLARQELAEAQALLEQAVKLDPANALVLQDLGVTYAKQRRLPQALACFRRALERAPDSPGLYANLGLASYHIGQAEEAVSHLRKAIWLGAGSADTYKNLARAMMVLPDPASAEECYWSALRLQPDDADAHYHLAQTLLMQGKFEQGWLEYEWRWRWRNITKRHLNRPQWTGHKLEGKRVLILVEEDARNTVQFARYADVIAQMGGRVVLECQPSLAKLMAGCLGVERTVSAGDTLPQHDFHVALMSLPATTGTTLQTLPAARPYLGVDTKRIALWRVRLDELVGMKVGIALDEDSSNNSSILRASCLRRLTSCPQLTLVDLQSRAVAGTLMSGQCNEIVPINALDPAVGDTVERFVTIAAILSNLDLLITVDNTIAHIAGAMGVPTWLILPVSCSSLWLQNRQDTPWYPTICLFRQRHRADWDEVAERVAPRI